MKSLLQSMISSLAAGAWIVLVVLIAVLGAESASVTVPAAKSMPAGEVPGTRPYEMAWADRKPPHVPLVNFDSLEGWQVESAEGAVADLIGSQRQRVWESPVEVRRKSAQMVTFQ